MTDGRFILQVNAADQGGGAERVALSLHREFASRGLESRLAVGRREGDDPAVIPLGRQGPGVVRRGFSAAGRWLDAVRGRETFRYPATAALLELTPRLPDVVLLHNLHGGYFDLRRLPALSARTTVVLSLHDAWLTSGHCAHSLDCDRWERGCGACPDLSLYPAIRRDATAFNWARKRRILSDLPVHLVTPCAWLMERAERSLLAGLRGERKVIPNGVDLTVFRPGDRQRARSKLRLPDDAKVLAFVASDPRSNPYKDMGFLRRVVERLGGMQPPGRTILLAVGGDGPNEQLGSVELRYVPFDPDPDRIAEVYRAADLYLHAARAETFPLAVLEALACGTPVVATEVGGLSEQVRSLPLVAGSEASRDDATGVLVPRGALAKMADSALMLLSDEHLRAKVGRAAAADARERFDLHRQADAYIRWFEALESAPPRH